MPRYYDGSDDRDLGPEYDDDACPSCGARDGEPCFAECECQFCQAAAERSATRDAFERGMSNLYPVKAD